jgi:hypothetical protein
MIKQNTQQREIYSFFYIINFLSGDILVEMTAKKATNWHVSI